MVAKMTTVVDFFLGSSEGSKAKDEAQNRTIERLTSLREPLTRLCATYLLQRGDVIEPAQDPVARFHLNNGASLERINWLADISKKGLRESLGLMVNYLYVPKAIESNHEKFVRGEIVASRQVRGLMLSGCRSIPLAREKGQWDIPIMWSGSQVAISGKTHRITICSIMQITYGMVPHMMRVTGTSGAIELTM